MKVTGIYLDGFRNYRDEAIEFSGGVNVISGSNAQGKTNLIEAVYYLTCGRSFRTSGDKDLIAHTGSSAVIRADIVSDGREQTLEARLSRVKRRELYANGAKLKKASELSGRLTAVLFNPDDLDMIKAGAAVRRRLMDACLTQLRPRYLAALGEFNRLYDHKTRILRDHRDKPSLLLTLDDFNLRLAQQSAQIIYYRAAFAALLSKKAAAIHHEFSGGAEELNVRYKTVKTIDNALQKPDALLPMLLEHQASHRQAELDSGLCLSGAHKDDLEIEIGGKSARSFASQGQARTASISIKLAEREICFEDRGEHPILLLDDVLSELDETRRSFVLNRIQDGQVFITCCEDGQIQAKTGGVVMRIEKGALLRKTEGD